MANIDVVPKRRSSAWVWWVLAIVLIVFLVWMIAGNASTAMSGQWRPIDIGERIAVLSAA